jgi:hypothetical protein
MKREIDEYLAEEIGEYFAKATDERAQAIGKRLAADQERDAAQMMEDHRIKPNATQLALIHAMIAAVGASGRNRLRHCVFDYDERSMWQVTVEYIGEGD